VLTDNFVVSKSFICVFILLIGLTLNAFFGSGPFSWGVGFVYIGYDTALLLFVSISMFKILRQTPSEVQKVQPIRIGVLITARNEATVLNKCLEALENQTDLPDCVFWIDDGSTDNTRELLTERIERRLPKLELRFKSHSGKASSLNQVWPEVDAEVLLTLDADTLLESNAIAEIRKAFSENPNLAATGGLLTPTSIFKPGQLFETFQRFEYIRSFLARRAWMNKNALLLVSGAFAAYRKNVLTEVGGYDPESLVEDYDLTHRIHRYSYDYGLNYEVGVTVAARATTDVPITLRQFLRQRRRWFAGFLQTQFKNGDMVGNRKYGSVGRFMLVIKSADTLQPVFGLITLATLVFFIASNRMIQPLIWKVLLAKIVIDLVFHYTSVMIYYRWRGQRPNFKIWALSTFSTFLEPVSFQVFRHLGAFLGWISFIRGNSYWHPQRKS
jgi:cellulose synthase/poly-beta-1,6-N-acetylglucosamine synthase-like glycosyltransferase